MLSIISFYNINNIYTYIYNFGFLEIGYTLTTGNKLCSDNGYMAVVELEICKKAARWLNKTFDTTINENKDNWPEGCFLSGNVYFNPHSTGSRNYDGRQICHAKGML